MCIFLGSLSSCEKWYRHRYHTSTKVVPALFGHLIKNEGSATERCAPHPPMCKTFTSDLSDVVGARLELRDPYPLVDAEEALPVHVSTLVDPAQISDKVLNLTRQI